jgi:hypothetical protein
MGLCQSTKKKLNGIDEAKSSKSSSFIFNLG